ncbi:MAG: transport-associated protein [Bacteroidetes bacterium]|nr:MAG: transport-associated protein [Bacteroidota bacterium]
MLFAFSWLIISSFLIYSCKSKPKDSDLQTAIESKINSNPDLSGASVSVKDQVATLTGELKTDAAKSSAESTAQSVEGVKQVINNITVATPAPAPAPVVVAADDPLTKGVNDAIKDYPTVKATVQDGVVTLTGEIKKANLTKLMQSLHTLKPKKIENKLTVK